MIYDKVAPITNQDLTYAYITKIDCPELPSFKTSDSIGTLQNPVYKSGFLQFDKRITIDNTSEIVSIPTGSNSTTMIGFQSELEIDSASANNFLSDRFATLILAQDTEIDPSSEDFQANILYAVPRSVGGIYVYIILDNSFINPGQTTATINDVKKYLGESNLHLYLRTPKYIFSNSFYGIIYYTVGDAEYASFMGPFKNHLLDGDTFAIFGTVATGTHNSTSLILPGSPFEDWKLSGNRVFSLKLSEYTLKNPNSYCSSLLQSDTPLADTDIGKYYLDITSNSLQIVTGDTELEGLRATLKASPIQLIIEQSTSYSDNGSVSKIIPIKASSIRFNCDMQVYYPLSTDTPVEITKKNVTDALGYTPIETISKKMVTDALGYSPVTYYTLTINAMGTDKLPINGATMTVSNAANDLPYATQSYNGEPVAFLIPDGFAYKVTGSDNVENHYGPTLESGVMSNNVSKTITYSVIGEIKTYADIQKLANLGIADRYFSAGDSIDVKYTLVGKEYAMPMDVVNVGNVELEDGSTKQGVWLQSRYSTIEGIQFDAPENMVATEVTAVSGWTYYGYDGTNYTKLSLAIGADIPYTSYTSVFKSTINDPTANITRYGYNRWSHSALEQWLNSSADVGNWWAAKHDGDVAPLQLNQYPGFMKGLDPSFLSVLGKVKVNTACNKVTDGGIIDTTYDTFFIPSLEQMYIKPEASGVEGSAWEYYKKLNADAGRTDLYALNSAYSELIKYSLDNHTNVQDVRSRSSNRSNSYNPWYVNTTGNITSNNALNAFRSAPACVIC